MIRSMTGFGSAECTHGEWILRAEVRSVNQKDLRVSFRIPEALRAREIELKKLVECRLSRGHVYVSVDCALRGGGSAALVDRGRLSTYLRELQELSEEQNVPLNVDLGGLLRLPDVLRSTASDEELQEQLWPGMVTVTQDAIQGVVAMREAEGASLAEQLTEICENIESIAGRISHEQGGFVAAYRRRLRERIERLLEGTDVGVDEDALAREVAHYADRCDVSEELARLRSHLAQFREALTNEDEEPVGRKMEFIGQEMHREAGTIGAKNPSDEQVPQVLELRTQIDRLREQVRNVE